jgi:hypothetical protein
MACPNSDPGADGRSKTIAIAITSQFSPCGLMAWLQVNSPMMCIGLYPLKLMALPPDASITPHHYLKPAHASQLPHAAAVY